MSSLSSMQFATRHAVTLGADDEYSGGSAQTGAENPMYQGVPDVVGISAETLSSSDRDTVWRVHRSGHSLPKPYSKRNAGSVFKFDA